MSEDLVKIRIPLQGVGRWTAETLWAEPLGDGKYRLRNIPWFTDDLHFLDVVRCVERSDDLPEMTELVESSGHDTLHLVFTERASRELRAEVLARLEARLGNIEHASGDAWSVDVNPDTDLDTELEYLGGLQEQGYLAG